MSFLGSLFGSLPPDQNDRRKQEDDKHQDAKRPGVPGDTSRVFSSPLEALCNYLMAPVSGSTLFDSEAFMIFDGEGCGGLRTRA